MSEEVLGKLKLKLNVVHFPCNMNIRHWTPDSRNHFILKIIISVAIKTILYCILTLF